MNASSTHSALGAILAEKRKEVDRLRSEGMRVPKGIGVMAVRDFKAAISVPNRISLIGEIKFASPSAGVIRERLDPLVVGQAYESARVAAVSLVTDRKFFGGNLEDLPALKSGISLPVLRKDFVVHEIQVEESFLWGADAVLLIARILSTRQLKDLLTVCEGFGMAALTEVHDRNDLDKALACGAGIIGINNRDLSTFRVDLKTTLELAPRVPEGHAIVSESGFRNREDMGLAKRAGVHAVLVGTALMESEDPGSRARELAGT